MTVAAADGNVPIAQPAAGVSATVPIPVLVSASAAKPAFIRPQQRWILDQPHPQAAQALANAANLPPVLAELLIARGIARPVSFRVFGFRSTPSASARA